ncbi:MAG TPA: aminoacyl-tRNA hydrolase [Terriglobia bacterium]|nr:aminoacyl-tRNA hydrolase [Terriglobia bacterium]
MKLIVGLGNPGYEYHLTPHNLGFMAVDRLAEACGVDVSRREGQALMARTELEGVEVLLAKPQTFMNLSGLAVERLIARYEVPVRDLLVLVDEAELPFGALRIRQRGSAGSHNGMKSIIGALQSDEFVRIRMGVQPLDHPVDDRATYVLSRFRKSDMEAVADMIDRAAEAVRVILRDGSQRAMNQFNRRDQPAGL